ncbi:DrmB family protein [Halobacillus andaensis]|uniref:DrmB family protein n=1 Tax=Halobacillus andaensis TaxID=1176239 RepID=UPI003D71374B
MDVGKWKKLNPAEISNKKNCKHCSNGHLVQVPFVVVCRKGHIDDFPWKEWVHSSLAPSCTAPIKLISTGGATLTSMRIECTSPSCLASRSLKGITTKFENNDSPLFSKIEDGEKYYCTGRKHWYGTIETSHENCKEKPFVLLKNSNNVYYPSVISALYLPGDYSNELEKTISFFKNDLILNEIEILQANISNDTVAKILKEKFPIDLEFAEENVIIKALEFINEETKEMEEDQYENILRVMRYQEYCSLIDEKEDKDLRVISEFNINYDKSPFYQYGLQKIHLVPKLRDTRILYGFQRLNSNHSLNRTSIKNGKSLLFKKPDALSNNWLPGYTVYGEGIFFEFDKKLLDSWEEKQCVKKHFTAMESRYKQVLLNGIIEERELSPRFVLLHTLAHVLISEMIFECGYSSSALRERIYVSKQTDSEMNGFLIYTASGDSEGTLGGLVRLGQTQNLIQILQKGIEKARWCSSDPVCTDIGIQSGQGIHSLNVAACHNCGYLPETSCEEFNMFLDRSLLVGTPNNPEIGFFGKVI